MNLNDIRYFLTEMKAWNLIDHYTKSTSCNTSHHKILMGVCIVDGTAFQLNNV
jgi:hypothetical protein